MRSLSVLRSTLCLGLLLAATPAAALSLPVSTVLSHSSTEQEEGGTPPDPLDALVTVELLGPELKITIDNNTGADAGSGGYDISEVWLNILGETITSVSPAGTGSSGFDLLGARSNRVGSLGTFATGFGVSGNATKNPDLIEAGEQNVMVLLGCADGDCSSAWLENNLRGEAVAAKFIRGGRAFGDSDDSAFGGSPMGFVPEPSTALLIGGGLLVLGARRRRQPPGPSPGCSASRR